MPVVQVRNFNNANSYHLYCRHIGNVCPGKVTLMKESVSQDFPFLSPDGGSEQIVTVISECQWCVPVDNLTVSCRSTISPSRKKHLSDTSALGERMKAPGNLLTRASSNWSSEARAICDRAGAASLLLSLLSTTLPADTFLSLVACQHGGRRMRDKTRRNQRDENRTCRRASPNCRIVFIRGYVYIYCVVCSVCVYVKWLYMFIAR